MRNFTFAIGVAMLAVMAGPPALAQAPFGIGEGGITIGGPSGLSAGRGGVVFGGLSGLSAGRGGVVLGGPSGLSAGPGGIAIGGPSGVLVGSGITIGGASEFDAVFGALPAAALGGGAVNEGQGAAP